MSGWKFGTDVGFRNDVGSRMASLKSGTWSTRAEASEFAVLFHFDTAGRSIRFLFAHCTDNRIIKR
jgi:hypothetical protein